MTVAKFVDVDGKAGEVELPSDVFETQVNVPVMHEVVRAQLAAARSGSHSTKTRAEVRGGGKKPWRQKGTGRARHGSIREPQWRGGGVAHGPKPRDYEMRINKKARRLALSSALSDRAREGKIVIVDPPVLEEPQTSRAVEMLEQWGTEGRTLLIVGPDRYEDMNLWKSFRNLPEVHVASYPTAYTVLLADYVVMTKGAVEQLSKVKKPAASEAEPAALASEARPASTVSKQEAPGTSESPNEVTEGGEQYA